MPRRKSLPTTLPFEPPTVYKRRRFPRVAYENYWRGLYYWSKWPRQKTARENAKAAAQCQRFYEAVEAVKRLPADVVEELRAQAQGTVYTWKDLAIALMYNRAYPVIEFNGTRFIPMTLREKASDILDNLGYVVGSILYRASDGWIALVPPPAAKWLKYNEAAQAPEWADLPPIPTGGGAIVTSVFDNLGTYFTGTAYLTPVVIPPGATIQNITWFLTTSANGTTWHAALYDSTASGIGNLVTTTPDITIANATLTQTGTFATPLNETTGALYWLAWEADSGLSWRRGTVNTWAASTTRAFGDWPSTLTMGSTFERSILAVLH